LRDFYSAESPQLAKLIALRALPIHSEILLCQRQDREEISNIGCGTCFLVKLAREFCRLINLNRSVNAVVPELEEKIILSRKI
jgi:hypothetical protein